MKAIFTTFVLMFLLSGCVMSYFKKDTASTEDGSEEVSLANETKGEEGNSEELDDDLFGAELETGNQNADPIAAPEETSVALGDDGTSQLSFDESTQKPFVVAPETTQSVAEAKNELPLNDPFPLEAKKEENLTFGPATPEPMVERVAPTSYTVRSGDTLMLVAFEVYGDYRMWKKLYNQNRASLGNSTNLRRGMVLDCQGAPGRRTPASAGLPYLIKQGDYLALISGKVYGSKKYWKEIWNNNLEMIKDPNVIFAGFTLFYQENPGNSALPGKLF